MGYPEDVNMEPPGESLYSLGGSILIVKLFPYQAAFPPVALTIEYREAKVNKKELRTTLKDLYGFLISQRRLERS